MADVATLACSKSKDRIEEVEMSRKMFDCRDWPGECALAITGEEEEVVQAQALHVVDVHGLQDTPEVRDQIRAALRDAPAGV
jgi:predicted small metal-binding protein